MMIPQVMRNSVLFLSSGECDTPHWEVTGVSGAHVQLARENV